LKAGALFIPIRQVARSSVGSCIVLIICDMLSDVNLHYLTLAARCLSADAGLLVLHCDNSDHAWFQQRSLCFALDGTARYLRLCDYRPNIV